MRSYIGGVSSCVLALLAVGCQDRGDGADVFSAEAGAQARSLGVEGYEGTVGGDGVIEARVLGHAAVDAVRFDPDDARRAVSVERDGAWIDVTPDTLADTPDDLARLANLAPADVMAALDPARAPVSTSEQPLLAVVDTGFYCSSSGWGFTNGGSEQDAVNHALACCGAPGGRIVQSATECGWIYCTSTARADCYGAGGSR
jgi:hypothetical protein